MAAKPRHNPTPTWPLDLERVVRTAGFRTRGSHRRAETMAIGMAAQQLGLDLSLWVRTLRYQVAGEEKTMDALVLFHGSELANIEMDRDWEAVANRLLRKARGATNEEKQAAYWICGAQALEINSMAASMQWMQDLVRRATHAIQEALAHQDQQQLEINTPAARPRKTGAGMRL